MKKLVYTISILCYLAVTSGIVINSHYCMKRLVSIHLFEKKAKACGRCGMDYHENNDCCRDEVKLVKLQQDQQQQVITTAGITRLAPMACTPSAYIVAAFENKTVQSHFYNNYPPLLSGHDTYMLNMVFRI